MKISLQLLMYQQFPIIYRHIIEEKSINILIMEQKQKITNIHRIRNERNSTIQERQSSLNNNQLRRTPKWLNSQCRTETTAPSMYRNHSRDQVQQRTYDNQNQIFHPRVEYNVQKYCPSQNVPELLKNFEVNFKKLINTCPTKYDELILICMRSYSLLKQVLTHYQNSGHLGPYFYQMHINSTSTKQNLLRLLSIEQNEKENQKQQNRNLKQEIKKLKKLIKNKDEAYFGVVDKNNELENKIKHMGAIIKSYEDDEIKFKEVLKEKDQKLKQLNDNKEIMMKDLYQIQNQIQTLNFIEQNGSNSSPHKKKSCKVIGSKVFKQKKPKKNKEFSIGQSNIEQDLYRFLLIQADTIEEYITEEEDY